MKILDDSFKNVPCSRSNHIYYGTAIHKQYPKANIMRITIVELQRLDLL